MKSVYLNFLSRLFAFSLILGIIAFAISYFLPKTLLTPTLPYLFPFFFAVTMIIHYLLLKAYERKHSRFITSFMLVIFLKLFFYLAIMVIYVLINKTDAMRFIITYFILYVFYTSFEVVSILSYTKTMGQKNIDAEK
ncbi:MAG: hypothetical protein KAG99_09305 [Bacteroidales bacterium]|nr:hypothetical protein [Bacteroidales bacterium]